MPAFIPLAVAAATATGLIGAAKISSGASGRAASLATDAANHAADVQAKSAAETLAFTKEQAAKDQAIAETTRRANYDQWRAREERMGSLGQLIGQGPRNIPDYVPLEAPGAAATDYGGGTTPAGGSDLSSAEAAFNKLFPDETLTPQMLTDHKSELEALGFTLRPNAAGLVGKVQYRGGPIIDVIQGAGSGLNKKWFSVGAPASAAAGPSGTLGAIAAAARGDNNVYGAAPLTPLYDPNATPYRSTRTLGTYAAGGY
jgi:hypothetical protein